MVLDLGSVGIQFNWVEKAIRKMLKTEDLATKEALYQEVQTRGIKMAEDMEKFGAASEQLSSQAELLKDQVSKFKLRIATAAPSRGSRN